MMIFAKMRPSFLLMGLVRVNSLMHLEFKMVCPCAMTSISKPQTLKENRKLNLVGLKGVQGRSKLHGGIGVEKIVTNLDL